MQPLPALAAEGTGGNWATSNRARLCVLEHLLSPSSAQTPAGLLRRECILIEQGVIASQNLRLRLGSNVHNRCAAVRDFNSTAQTAATAAAITAVHNEIRAQRAADEETMGATHQPWAAVQRQDAGLEVGKREDGCFVVAELSALYLPSSAAAALVPGVVVTSVAGTELTPEMGVGAVQALIDGAAQFPIAVGVLPAALQPAGAAVLRSGARPSQRRCIILLDPPLEPFYAYWIRMRAGAAGGQTTVGVKAAKEPARGGGAQYMLSNVLARWWQQCRSGGAGGLVRGKYRLKSRSVYSEQDSSIQTVTRLIYGLTPDSVASVVEHGATASRNNRAFATHLQAGVVRVALGTKMWMAGHWDEGTTSGVTYMLAFVRGGLHGEALEAREKQQEVIDALFVHPTRKAGKGKGKTGGKKQQAAAEAAARAAAPAAATAAADAAAVAAMAAAAAVAAVATAGWTVPSAVARAPRDAPFSGVLQAQITAGKKATDIEAAVLGAFRGASSALSLSWEDRPESAQPTAAYSDDPASAYDAFVDEFDAALASKRDGRRGRMAAVSSKFSPVFGSAFKNRLALFVADGASANLGIHKGAALSIRRELLCLAASVWRCGPHSTHGAVKHALLSAMGSVSVVCDPLARRATNSQTKSGRKGLDRCTSVCEGCGLVAGRQPPPKWDFVRAEMSARGLLRARRARHARCGIKRRALPMSHCPSQCTTRWATVLKQINWRYGVVCPARGAASAGAEEDSESEDSESEAEEPEPEDEEPGAGGPEPAAGGLGLGTSVCWRIGGELIHGMLVAEKRVMLDPASPRPDGACVGDKGDGAVAAYFHFVTVDPSKVEEHAPGFTLDRMRALSEIVEAGPTSASERQALPEAEQTRRRQFVQELRNTWLQNRELVVAQTGVLKFLFASESERHGCLFEARGMLKRLLAPLRQVEAGAHDGGDGEGDESAAEKFAVQHFHFAAQHAQLALAHGKTKHADVMRLLMCNIRAVTRPLLRYLERELEYLEHDVLSQVLSLMDPGSGRQHAMEMVCTGRAELLRKQASRLGLPEEELQRMIDAGEASHLEILGSPQDDRAATALWQELEAFASSPPGTALAVELDRGQWALAFEPARALFEWLYSGKYLTFGNHFAEFLVKVIKAQDEQTRREIITAGNRVAFAATQGPLMPGGSKGAPQMRVARAHGEEGWATRAAQTGAASTAEVQAGVGGATMAAMSNMDDGILVDEDEHALDPHCLGKDDLQQALLGRHVEVMWSNMDAQPEGSTTAQLGALRTVSLIKVGTEVWKRFGMESGCSGEAFGGTVTEARTLGGTVLYHVKYGDGDEEDLSEEEVRFAAHRCAWRHGRVGGVGTDQGNLVVEYTATLDEYEHTLDHTRFEWGKIDKVASRGADGSLKSSVLPQEGSWRLAQAPPEEEEEEEPVRFSSQTSSEEEEEEVEVEVVQGSGNGKGKGKGKGKGRGKGKGQGGGAGAGAGRAADAAASGTAGGGQRGKCEKCDNAWCPRSRDPQSECRDYKKDRQPEVIDLTDHVAMDADRPYDVYRGGRRAAKCQAGKAAVLARMSLKCRPVPGDGFCGYHALAHQLGITTLELLQRLVVFAEGDAGKDPAAQEVARRGPPCQHGESSGCARKCWIEKLKFAANELSKKRRPILDEAYWFDSLLACWVACMESRVVICVVAQEFRSTNFTCSMHTRTDHGDVLEHTGRASANRQHRMTAVVHPRDAAAAAAVRPQRPLVVVHNGHDHWESTEPVTTNKGGGRR
jgi:hypothetical protein